MTRRCRDHTGTYDANSWRKACTRSRRLMKRPRTYSMRLALLRSTFRPTSETGLASRRRFRLLLPSRLIAQTVGTCKRWSDQRFGNYRCERSSLITCSGGAAPVGPTIDRRKPVRRSRQWRHRPTTPTAHLPTITRFRARRDADRQRIPRKCLGPSRRECARGMWPQRRPRCAEIRRHSRLAAPPTQSDSHLALREVIACARALTRPSPHLSRQRERIVGRCLPLTLCQRGLGCR